MTTFTAIPARYRALALFTGTTAIAAVLAMAPASAEEINALVWCDHTDDALLEPFTKATGIEVNVKDYEGTGTALTLVDQSQPGDWDVFVVDSTDVKRVVDRGLLAPVDPGLIDMSAIPDAVKAEDLHMVDGKWYAFPEKFGYNAIAYNRDKVSEADMRKAASMWDPKFKGEVAIYDYYLPIISQIAVGLGMNTADFTADDIPAVREKLFEMKKNAKLVSDVVTSQTALATGEVDILVGGGEYAVASLMAEQPELDWVLPAEGGVRWQQAIGVFADSEKKDAAGKFVAYILSPEGQARLATSSCYWGMPANMSAALTDAEKKSLRWDEQPAFIKGSQRYISPSEDLDTKLQDLWTEFLQQ